MNGRAAVVLFNLGGPDRLASVEPFLFNLFNDPAIISAPAPLRWLIAKLIAKRRAPIAREIYRHLGGGSPLRANTEAQALALEAALGGSVEVRCFVAMRYWHPFTEDAVRDVAAWAPEKIVLLPLYPQYSTTTTGSSLAAWRRAARKAGLAAPTIAICCYPRAQGFIAAVAERVRAGLAEAAKFGTPRVLFSAHGLPKKIVAAGDPYRWQVEETCRAIVAKLARSDFGWPNLDHVVCYQSRVGPLEWLTPSTDREIERAGAERRPLVIVPVAFVSEHSETLVELDIEYRKLGQRTGVPAYIRVPTVATAPAFIEALAVLVRGALRSETATRSLAARSGEGGRICPAATSKCGCGRDGAAA
jgi:protoporphyrin/coproporphyrin ferrochelatase